MTKRDFYTEIKNAVLSGDMILFEKLKAEEKAFKNKETREKLKALILRKNEENKKSIEFVNDVFETDFLKENINTNEGTFHKTKLKKIKGAEQLLKKYPYFKIKWYEYNDTDLCIRDGKGLEIYLQTHKTKAENLQRLDFKIKTIAQVNKELKNIHKAIEKFKQAEKIFSDTVKENDSYYFDNLGLLNQDNRVKSYYLDSNIKDIL